MKDDNSSQIAGQPNSLVVGIDASRNRSGGARAHIIGVLSALDPREHGIARIHVWSYQNLLDQLPDAPWLIKHCPAALDRSIISQMWWQRLRLHGELESNGCDILLSTDAGSLCRFAPSVVMSRDMLSFELGEINRYGISVARLRLMLRRSMQLASLRSATGAMFLTQYASVCIQKYSGPLSRVRVIPHGIGDNFRQAETLRQIRDGCELRCVYVSNADRYKHQWHVIEAASMVRASGTPIQLMLVGAGVGPATGLVKKAVRRFDPEGAFVTITPFVPHAAVPEFLAEADIFVFASSCENMPNTLVEAMASRLAIACSSRGPMPEILQDSGEYFDPEVPASIAAALKRLAIDPALRVEKAKCAGLLADKYSWRRCASETWTYLNEIAHDGRLRKYETLYQKQK